MAIHNRHSSRSGGKPSPFGGGAKHRQTPVGIILIALAVLACVGAVWFYSSARSTLVELRPTDLCPKDTNRAPPEIYAILIDQTDKLDPLAQQSIVNTLLAKLRSELEGPESQEKARNALVEIWTFSNIGKNVTTVGEVRVATERVLSMCNPGAPAEWDKLYRNVDVVRRQHARFYASLEETIKTSLSFPDAKESPVIEAIYAIGVQVFSRPEAIQSRKYLFIISDLLQNTQNLRMHSGRPPRYESWIGTQQGQRALPALSMVNVNAFVLPSNQPQLQGNDFAQFWMSLFKGAGAATPVRLDRVR